ELYLFVQWRLGNEGPQRVEILHIMAVEFTNDVARLHAPLGCGRSGNYLRDSHSFCVRAVFAGLQRSHLDTKVTANDPALLQQAFQRSADSIRWNREPDSLRAASGRGDRCVDPDHFATQVDQRSATVSRIDRGIGLNQITK